MVCFFKHPQASTLLQQVLWWTPMDQCQARSVRVEGRQTVTDRLHDSTGIRGHVSGEPNLGPLGDSCSGETRLLSARLAGLWRLGTLLGVEPGVCATLTPCATSYWHGRWVCGEPVTSDLDAHLAWHYRNQNHDPMISVHRGIVALGPGCSFYIQTLFH